MRWDVLDRGNWVIDAVMGVMDWQLSCVLSFDGLIQLRRTGKCSKEMVYSKSTPKLNIRSTQSYDAPVVALDLRRQLISASYSRGLSNLKSYVVC